MHRPKVKTALTAMLFILGLMFAAFAVFAVDRMNDLNSRTATIAGQLMPALKHAENIEVAFGDLKVGVRDHVIAQQLQSARRSRK